MQEEGGGEKLGGSSEGNNEEQRELDGPRLGNNFMEYFKIFHWFNKWGEGIFAPLPQPYSSPLFGRIASMVLIQVLKVQFILSLRFKSRLERVQRNELAPNEKFIDVYLPLSIKNLT